MTKVVKFSITIEIEKGQRTKAEFKVQSNNFGQEVSETIRRLSEIISEEILQNYDDQLQKEEARGIKTIGWEKMEAIGRVVRTGEISASG